VGQVNVNYDDRILAGIDRICSAKGMSRTELMRSIASEAVEAHDAGRLAFQEVNGPKLGGTLNALATQLRDNVIEQDRLLRSTQRHEKKMLDALAPNAEAIRAAEEKLSERVTNNNRKSYEPFVDVARKLRDAFGEAAERMANAQDARLQKIEQRLEAIRAEASAPRNHYKVVFPGDFSIGFLAALGSIVALIGAFVVLLAATNMEWLGVPIAKKLLPTTELVCRVIDDRYGVRDCAIPAEYRQGPVRAAKAGK
jgi:hypothetical protein